MTWQENLIVGAAQIRDLVLQTKLIAVLGIKTEAQAGQPAFYVPQYLVSAGFDVVPVPVYYPAVTEILGRKVFRKLTEIPDEIDLVDVFRRSHDIAGHLMIYWQKNQRRSGFSRGFAMTRLPSSWPKRASKSSRTAV